MSTPRKVRGYWPTLQAFRALPRLHTELEHSAPTLAAQWALALDKDATGQNCVRLYQDWQERLQPMAWDAKPKDQPHDDPR